MSEHSGITVPKILRNSQAPGNGWDEIIAALARLAWVPTEFSSPGEFKRAFIARVRRARRTTGWNQREMAEALDIPLKNYEAYESRTLLPHHLIWQFARIARVPLDYLYTGRLPPELARADPERAAVLLEQSALKRRRRTEKPVSYGSSEKLL
jgi:transcriptional regulator with XRE-family HTH domain